MKVAKFGGSSLADGNQFKKVKDIVLADRDRRYVVVSAAGKRNKDDNKITDLLYLCYAHIKYSVSHENMVNRIEERYRSIKEELGLTLDIEKEFAEIRSHLKKGMNKEYLVSRGEYLSAILMAEALGYDFVDAKDLIFFDYDGKVNYDKTRKAIEAMKLTHDKAVIPGFYGVLPDGEIKVFSRGGSDITGSIVADCVGADIYENWTDVSGILMADPNVVKNPKGIEVVTYSELRELSYMGANVLHTDAVYPVKHANIPINIRNTNDPANNGTTIVNDTDKMLDKYKNQIVTGISGKKDYTVISVYKDGMSEEVGALCKILGIFGRYGISIEHVPTSVDSLSVVASSNSVKKYIYEIIADIKREYEPNDIKVEEGISLIATVGRNMKSRTGMSGELFALLGRNNINIRIISQGSDEINITVGVENKDFETAINVIYNNIAIQNA